MGTESGSPDTTVRTLRIIVFAMIVGVLALTAAAGALAPLGTPDDALRRILILVVALMGMSSAAGYAVLRAQLLASARKQMAEGSQRNHVGLSAVRQYQSLIIVGSAMAEGVGLLGAVAVLVTAYWPLAAVPLAAVLLLTLNMPSRDKLDAFIERLTAPLR